jgi:hypothetical protein
MKIANPLLVLLSAQPWSLHMIKTLGKGHYQIQAALSSARASTTS